MTDDETELDAAIETVARQALTNVIESIQWDDYPEVGEFDFAAVIEAARKIAAQPPLDVYQAAYKVLDDRANGADHD